MIDLVNMIIGYSRVSSKEQDIEKYNHFFNRYAKDLGITFDEIVLEKISASKTNIQKRILWDYINNPKVTKIIVTEVSRLGRSMKDGVDIVNTIINRRDDIKIYIVSCNLTVHKNMTANEKFLFNLQMSLATRETEILSERIKIGLDKARADGKKLGRPKGSRSITDLQLSTAKGIIKLGGSISEAADAVGVSRNTIYKYVINEDEK